MQAEGNKYIAGMIGYSGDIPPSDEAGHVEFIKSIQPPDLWDVRTSYHWMLVSGSSLARRATVPVVLADHSCFRAMCGFCCCITVSS